MIRKQLMGAVACAAAIAWGAVAQAGVVTSIAETYTGNQAKVKVTFDELANPGSVQVSLKVIEPMLNGDLLGFFFNVSDDISLSGLSVSGANITNFVTGRDSISTAGSAANNVNPLTGFDAGVQIGQPGASPGNFFPETTFTISHATESLGLDDLFFLTPLQGNTPQTWYAVRVLSIDGEGSAKLIPTEPLPPTGKPEPPPPPGSDPIPEPTSALVWSLLLVGGGLAARRHHRRRNAKSELA